MSLPERKPAAAGDPTAEEVLEGLARRPRQIAPKYFYDEQGSELFDAITELDEYYIPRVEASIFAEHHRDICDAIGPGKTIVEPGAGSCEKIKWLLPHLGAVGYVPMDISGEHLRISAASLRREFPELIVEPRVCDHTEGIELNDEAGESLTNAPPVFFYPGSSIGNFEPEATIGFLGEMRAQMKNDAGLLIGVDTKKDHDVLHAAYNDSQGITAAFNLNVLSHLNDLLEGDLSAGNFEHVADYNPQQGRIEMHLRCRRDHSAQLAGEQLDFTAGELIHTENSYKYHPDEFTSLAAQSGLRRSNLWQDSRGWFSVMYFVPA